MRVHLLAPVPHRDVTDDWEPCAYTGKALRLCRMLAAQGIDVVFYGGPRLDAPVAEHVVVTTDVQRAVWFGGQISHEFNQFDPQAPCWAETNETTIAAIRERWQPGDILGLTMGAAQVPVASAFAGQVVAEVGVGYEGVLTSTHWCVESEAWRHYLYGRKNIVDGRFYDVVIPNAFNPDEHDYRPDHDGYLLYLGRMIDRKGLAVVGELAKRHRVVTAGPGDQRVSGAEHVGLVTGDDKRKLLAGAKAVLVPTIYVEPFGGVAVEAMMSGVPVITTPWGAFSETVVPGTGWRCHTLSDFLSAVHMAGDIDRAAIRAYATARFSTATVGRQYARWLKRLEGLYAEGWNA